MVFSSLTFIFMFLPVVMLIYYIVPEKVRNLFILLSGLFFYAWGEPIYVFVLILSTLIDYFAGLVMDKFNDSPAVRRCALVASVIMNLSLLGFFKYSAFIVENINNIFNTSYKNPTSLLPIGISFFTFQSMSYTIDLYRRNIKVQKNPVDFAAFVTLFPQIVAGPIVRYDDIAKELKKRYVSLDMLYSGIIIFTCGLGKKVLIANSIGQLWDMVKAQSVTSISVLTAWLGILAYTLQIYFDFSGYSDMAVGLGKMLGFNFPKNFDYPYMSKSITEFWHRWHITLGNWFRSYVYIPLGGNRKGTKRTIINLAVVWVLTGIWHGASWNFVVWGAFYGILIIIEKLFLGKWLKKLPGCAGHIYTMLFVIIGWAIFDGTTLSYTASYIGRLFDFGGNLLDKNTLYYLINFLVIFVVAIIGSTNLLKKAIGKIGEKSERIKEIILFTGTVAVFLLSIAYLADASYNPFLYFNF